MNLTLLQNLGNSIYFHGKDNEYLRINIPFDATLSECIDKVAQCSVRTDEKTMQRLFVNKRNYLCNLHAFFLGSFAILLTRITSSNDISIITDVPTTENDKLMKMVYEGKLHEQDSFQCILDEVNLLIERLLVAQCTDEGACSENTVVLPNIALWRYDEETVRHINTDMSLVYEVDGKEIRVVLYFNSELFSDFAANSISNAYFLLIKEMLEDLSLSIDKALDQVCNTSFNMEGEVYKEFLNTNTVLDRLYDQVTRRPTEIVITTTSGQITYEQLWKMIGSLSSELSQNGCGIGDIIAFQVQDPLLVGVAMYAIMSVGAAYLPIDIDAPTTYRTHVLDDCNCKTLIVEEGNNDIACGEQKLKLFTTSVPFLLISEKVYVPVQISSENLAYIIYTSGTTGRPKGVMVEHRNLLNFIDWRIHEYKTSATDVTLQLLSPAFDGYASNFYMSTLSGGNLICLNNTERKDIALIGEMIQKYSVTNTSIVPTMYNAILYNLPNGVLNSLRFVVLAGETASPQTLYDSRNLYPKLQLINEYGPTECTITAMFNNNFMETAANNIGKPISNTYFFILNECGKVQIPGLPGELCLGGMGVARGYINDVRMTNTRFIRNPFKVNERMYRTGDRVCLLKNGTLEFLGRIDRQVKVKGYRVDLLEVENKLRAFESVRETAVVVYKGSLYAYVVTSRDYDMGRLKDELKEVMPAYMIPTMLISLSSLPMQVNGKVDYNALLELAPMEQTLSNSKEITYSNIQMQVIEIWKDILKVDLVQLDDNFFAIGGNSMLAAILINRLNKDLLMSISLRDFLDSPTIRTITCAIAENSLLDKTIIEKAPVNEMYPLSSAQKRLVILHQMNPDSLNYNISTVIKIKEYLEAERLENCFNLLISRHEMLRSSFQMIDGEPIQQISENVSFCLETKTLAADDIAVFLKQFVQPYDLTNAPLFRAAIVYTQKESILVLDMHHIIMDGSSQIVFLRELFLLYQEKCLEFPIYRYMDYVYTQQKDLERIQDQKKYWLNQFDTIPDSLDLPVDYPRSTVQNYEGADVDFEVPASVVRTLCQMAAEMECTVFHLLYSAMGLLMNIYTGQDDMVIGTVSQGRTRPEWENIIGLFVNTLAIRTQPKPNKILFDYILEVKKVLTEGIKHQEYQYDDLVRLLKIPKETNSGSLIDVLIAYNEIDYSLLGQLPFQYEVLKFESKTTKFDLTLLVNHCGNSITCTFQYATSLFKSGTILRMKDYYLRILECLPLWKNHTLSSCSVLSEAERHHFLYEVHGEIEERNNIAHPAVMLEQKAMIHPKRMAVVSGDVVLTYAELNAKAMEIATQLYSFGVTEGDPVAVVCGRSVGFLLSVYGVLKLGASYVPIDPAYPKNRIQTMLGESGARVVIVDVSIMDEFGTVKGLQWLIIDSSGNITGSVNKTVLPEMQPYSTELPIYLIFTSGSTGTPKGVAVRMRAFLNLLDWYVTDFNFGPDTRALLMASVSFDAAQKNLFAALASSGCLYIYSDTIYNYEKICKIIYTERITTLNCTPNAFYPLVDYAKQDGYSSLMSLRTVFLGGESIDAERLSDWALGAGCNCCVINTYGPTECTDILTYYVLRKEDYMHSCVVPIGKPLRNVRLYVMNSSQQLVPKGVSGELYAGGIGVSLGYVNEVALTREKFVEVSALPGQKLYRTGDIVRWNEDDLLEFVERRDQQVKIRGYRIEIEEIEACIRRFEGIEEVVVIVQGEGDNRALFAYVVVQEGTTLNVSLIRVFLQRHLPSYMIPVRFIPIDAIPLNVNGKTDRKKLAAIQVIKEESIEADDTELSSDMKSRLICIWKDVLGVDEVTANGDFFELGGHSLSAIRLLSKLNQTFPVPMDFATFLKNSTIQQMASYYESVSVQTEADLISSENKNRTAEWFNGELIACDKENMYEPFPMNDTQISYLLGRNDFFLLGGVSTHLYMEISTHLDVAKLNRCLNRLILRHPMLRAIFSINGTQKILKQVPDYQIEQIDGSQMTEKEIEKVILEERQRMSHHIFQCDEWPLFEVRTVAMPDTSIRIMFGFDAMIGDGYSLQLMAKDIMRIYLDEETELPALAITYRDYCLAMERYKKTEAYAKDEAFWNEKLANFPPSPAIPLLIQPRNIEQPHFEKLSHHLSAKQWIVLKKCACSMQVTPSALLCTLYAKLLSFWANQKELGINVTVFNRVPIHPDVECLVGDFTSIMLIDVRLCEDGDLRKDAIAVHTSIMQALEHRYYDGTNIIRKLANIAGIKNTPPMPIVFTGALFDDMSFDNEENSHLGEVSYVSTQTSQVYIDNKVYIGTDGCLCIEWDYVRELFYAEDIQRYFDLYIKMICSVAENDQLDLHSILLPDAENMLQIAEYNNTEYLREEVLLHSGVSKYAAATPEQIAVIDGSDMITYDELDRLSNCMAHYLIDKYGAGTGKNVAVRTQRKISTIVNILAVLKAGAAYVPIELEYPVQRVDYIMEHTGCLCELRDDSSLFSIVEKYDNKPVDLKVSPTDNAYIIFTSGSTGAPKGVTITHAAAMNTIADMVERLNLSQDDRILGISSMCFDLSVFDIFGTLAAGATLVLVKDQRNMIELRSLIVQHGITIWNSVPALLSIYIESLDIGDKQESIRYVLLSGDWIRTSLPAKARACFPYALVMSLGGATETSIWSIYYMVNQDATNMPSVPYGMPLSNQRFYVLNYWGGLCPSGVSGELYIGGKGLAEGYWNDSENTKEAFVFHSQLGRLYRTGDFGILHKEGYIEFLGRQDNQVKLYGHRIELGEIESVITKCYPQITCVVTIVSKENDVRKICAYLEKKSDISVESVHQKLKETLPEYMLPEYIVLLEKFPLTLNGKVDRKNLPKPQDLYVDAIQDYVAPSNRDEEKLQAVWKEVLRKDVVGTTVNFFETGGDSLRAIKLITGIQKVFDLSVPYRDIYEHATIQDQANLLRSFKKVGYKKIPVSKPMPYYPLSVSQQRFYVLDRIAGKTTAYNLLTAVHIKGEIDLTRIETAIFTMFQRHDVFRSSFHILDGEPVCIVHENVEFHLEELHMKQKEKIEQVLQNYDKPFELSCAPLFRAAVIKIASEECVLMLEMHHIISDGISMDLVFEELMQFYVGNDLDRPALQYHDYVVWAASQDNNDILERQKVFWLKTLQDLSIRADIPADFKRPGKQSFHGRTISSTVNPIVYGRIKKFCKDLNISLFTIMAITFSLVLHKYTSSEDILIGTPVSGRNHADIQRMIGLFINTVLLRSYPTTKKAIEDFLNEVRDMVLDVLSNQEYPFEMLVDCLDEQRDPSRNALYDYMLVVKSEGDFAQFNQELQITPLSLDSQASKCDMTLQAIEYNGSLQINVEYCTDLFCEETVSRFISHILRTLECLPDSMKISIGQLDILLEEENRQVTEGFNQTTVVYDDEVNLHKLFETQVIQTPHAIALLCLDKEWTYCELNEKANRLAHRLMRQEVRADQVVGIKLDRSVHMVVGLLAILKAGGAYLPIDPNCPNNRIEYMLKNCNVKILLTDGEFDTDSNICVIDITQNDAYDDNIENPSTDVHPNHLAYVIYTSGSTGDPKGVMIEHHSIVNRLRWMQNQYQLQENDIILQKTLYTFDVSLWELFWWQMVGARACMLEPEGEKRPEVILQCIEKNQVTTLHFVPSMLQVFLEYIRNKNVSRQLCTIRHVFVSGEVLRVDVVHLFYEIFPASASLHNLYGPTEAAVDVSYYDCTGDEVSIVPIGQPIDNTRLYVLDDQCRLQPIGVYGELYIAGKCLARGYANASEMTERVFLDVQIGRRKERVYRTGDIVRWLPNGMLDFKGRSDYQIKLRGYRVELLEIESSLNMCSWVKESVVQVEGKGNALTLVAYLSLNDGGEAEQVQKHLENSLPQYMIPSHLVVLPELPKLSNGKINRKALSGKLSADIGGCNANPSDELTNIEKQVLDAWKVTLQVENICIDDDFFKIGGNSISAIKLEVELEKRNFLIHYDAIYDYKTVRSQAAYLAGMGPKEVNIPYTTAMKNPILSQKQYSFAPFNDFFYRSCFYNVFLPIIQASGHNIWTFFVCSIPQYYYSTEDIGRSGVRYYDASSWEEQCNDIGISVNKIALSKDIIKECIEQLRNGRPCLVWMDPFYLPQRKDAYMKKHIQHCILVYDYDSENNKFLVIEHKRQEQLSYAHRTLSACDLLAAYEGLLNYYNTNKLLSPYSLYTFDLTNVSSSTYTVEQCREKYMQTIQDGKLYIVESMEHLNGFLADFDCMFCDEKDFYAKVENMVECLNEICNAKEVELALARVLLCDEQISIRQDIFNQWNEVRCKIVKTMYKQSYDIKVLRILGKKVQIICTLELQYYESLDMKLVDRRR